MSRIFKNLQTPSFHLPFCCHCSIPALQWPSAMQSIYLEKNELRSDARRKEYFRAALTHICALSKRHRAQARACTLELALSSISLPLAATSWLSVRRNRPPRPPACAAAALCCSGEVPWASFPKTLQEIRLAANKLEGGLPANISESLTELDVSGNKLSGRRCCWAIDEGCRA